MPRPHRIKVDRDATDISPKVLVVPIVGILSVVVQAVVSGQLDAAELNTALTTLVASVIAYLARDTVKV